MFHAANFASQKKYRQKNFSTCPEDRPLFVQFCANNATTLLEAANHVKDQCDAIDINLGCPQEIARRGHYGAYLQDDWELISEMVTKLRNNLDQQSLGVSCKIRRFDDVQKTVQYGQMLERAGCTFIGVHARTREQRGCKTGLADWKYIKEVKNNVNIPVIANGNIQSLRDAELCLETTNADAVMTAEGNLYNPALFHNVHPPAWQVADKYLDYVEKYPIPAGMAKSHIFKLFHRCLAIEDNASLRSGLGQCTSLEQLRDIVDQFRRKYRAKFSHSLDQEGDEHWSIPITVQPVPEFYCQPRYRYHELGTSAAGNSTAKADKKAMENSNGLCKLSEQPCGQQQEKRIKLGTC